MNTKAAPSSRNARPGKTAAAAAARARRAPLPPAVAAERERIFEVLKPVVALMELMLSPNIEVVLHDLTAPGASVVAIANGRLTGRRVGSPILSGPKDDKAFSEALRSTEETSSAGHSVVGVYPTVTAHGAPLQSATAIYRDSTGTPFAALCVNADLSVLRLAHEWLGRALEGHAPAGDAPRVEVLPDLDGLIAEIIQTAVDTLGKPVPLMTKDEKIQAVEQMLRRGLFVVKGSVPRVAKALHLTRYSIYNYLEQIRSRDLAAALR